MADRAQKCGMVMSVTTQIIFSHMSDARAPAMDVQMAPQDAGMARSFWLILSPLLIESDVRRRIRKMRYTYNALYV